MIRTLCTFAGVLGMLGMTGCAKTESSDLLTTGIYAELSAHGSGGGMTTVYATLFVGDPNALNFVELAGDDQLVVSHGSDRQVMTQTELGNLVSNTATVATDADGTELAIALDRTIDDGAPASTMTLPARFAVGPVATPASRAATATVTWSPSGTADPMAWTATGDCITNTQGTIGGDIGTVTIAAGTFVKAPGSNVPDSCMITFTISRTRAGKLDSHYGKGGHAIGSQDRVVTWTSTP